MVVPHVTKWSGEHEPAATVVERRGGGIGYARENLLDRDEFGVLWSRCVIIAGAWSARVRQGAPAAAAPGDDPAALSGVRRACRPGLRWWRCCGCGMTTGTTGPSGRRACGSTEPPVCRSCVGLAVRLCPALRHGAVAMRVGDCPIVGVYGTYYRRGPRGPVPVKVANVKYNNPFVGWVQADHLVRQLWDCTLLELDELAEVGPCRS